MASSFRIKDLGDAPWVAEYAREFALTVAANQFASMASRKTCYNVELEARVAERVMPLDLGLSESYHGVIDVPPHAEEWKRVEEATAFLGEMPRGAWAVFRMDGGYDAYMSNGLGGVETATGDKFKGNRPGQFTFERLYADVIASEAYYQRDSVTKAIHAESFARHTVPRGTTVHDEYLGGHRQKKIEYLAPACQTPFASQVSDPDAPVVKATRPGVKAKMLALTPSGFVELFKVPLQLPPGMETALDEPHRLSTLLERRTAAAAAATAEQLPEGAKFDNPLAYWRQDGTVLRRSIWLATDAPGAPSRAMEVEFAPGGDTPLATRPLDAGLPSLALAR